MNACQLSSHFRGRCWAALENLNGYPAQGSVHGFVKPSKKGIYGRRQLTRIDQYHISEEKLDQAIQCFVNAYQRCALPRCWGSPEHASIDGTKWEIYEQNLLSEQHIRYGGYSAIAM